MRYLLPPSLEFTVLTEKASSSVRTVVRRATTSTPLLDLGVAYTDRDGETRYYTGYVSPLNAKLLRNILSKFIADVEGFGTIPETPEEMAPRIAGELADVVIKALTEYKATK
jgi:hypothetical protein